MSEKMKPGCVGRCLIDMPEEAQVALARARIHGLDISAFDESDEEFQSRPTERDKQIKSMMDRFRITHLRAARGASSGKACTPSDVPCICACPPPPVLRADQFSDFQIHAAPSPA